MIYTFYSFKGGVGRSMAMASTAWLLARRGLRVLAIDFDLEAPGLERYFFNDERALEDLRSKPGLIDLLLTYKRALTSEAEFERAEFRDWRRYTTPAIPNTPEGGSVDLMSAGRRHPQEAYAQYALHVRAFDWQDFFHNWQGGGFFDWLRRALTDRERDPRNAYDVVLVDSRTGVTEMGGVCAYQLADAVVLLCAPNYQNMDGTLAVLRDFRSDAVIALRNGRPLELVLLPARVEPSDAGRRAQFFDTLRRFFGAEGMPRALMQEGLDYERLAVPYQKELAIIERVVDEGAGGDAQAAQTQSAIRRSFETLTDALLLLSEGQRWSAIREQARARLRGEGPATTAVQADVSQRGAGYDVFLVAHPQDWLATASIAASLSERGLDVMQERGALQSERREQALSQLLLSRVLLVAIGAEPPSEAYWQCYRHAQMSKVPKPLVALLLAGEGPPEQRLRDFGLPPETAAIDLRPDGALHADRIEPLLDALHPQREAAPATETAGADGAVYPGRAALSEDQAALLVGRDAEVDQLFALVGGRTRILLEGAHGVGKRSLVQAGLLPRLRAGEMQNWRIESIDLAAPDAAVRVEAEFSREHTTPVLYLLFGVDHFALGGGPQAREQRIEWIRRFVDHSGAQRRLLLVATGALPDAERAAIERIVFGDTERGARMVLAPLTPDAHREAVERPAARAGHLFEPGLVDRLLRDAGAQPGAITQLQLALDEIWTARRRGWLTNHAYDEGGGIAGRFDRRLVAFLAELAPQAQAAVQVLLCALVQFDSQLRLSPHPVDWALLAGIPAIAAADAEALRDRLAAARLIDVWRAPEADGTRERLWCALAQPTPGPTIEAWARGDVEFLLWQQRFATFLGREGTLAGAELDSARQWLAARPDRVSDLAREMIEGALAHRAKTEEHEREQERRTARLLRQRVRLLGGGVAVTLGLLAVAGYLAYSLQGQNRDLDLARQIAEEQREQVEKQNAELELQAEEFRQQLGLSTAQREQRQQTEALLREIQTRVEALPREQAAAVLPEQERNRLRALLAGEELVPTVSSVPPSSTQQTVTVYIQYSDAADRERAERYRSLLDGSSLDGFAVRAPGVERVKVPVTRSVLRCFRDEECQAPGKTLLAELNALGTSSITLENLSDRYGNLKGVGTLQFELWLAPPATSRLKDLMEAGKK